ncbi:hypothetical protein [Streptomyces sp. NPDC089799]|uniref:hypothetical protein n=1 Tax=Streptomyces sp. NPDC089799 TaxID=3155066 RepID=UPI0034493D8F
MTMTFFRPSSPRGRITISAILVLAAALTGIVVYFMLPDVQPSGDSVKGSVRDASADAVDLEKRIAGFTQSFGERGGYRIPTERERHAVAGGVALVLDGRMDEARARLAEVDFAVQPIKDSVSGRRFAEVADAAARSDGANRGWGRVYVDLDAKPAWIVQVPHPVADQNTERLGAQVLRGAPGGVLVLAGAHRNAAEGGAADVAHRTDSVFHDVIGELMNRRLPGLQLHGFANSSIPEFDAVVSTGAGDRAVSEAKLLSRELDERGLDVCRAYTRKCRLSGSSNEQGLLAAEEKLGFLHLEIARRNRISDGRLGEVAQAIGVLTQRWAKG